MNATVSPAVRLKIQGMDCGSCALTIEQAVRTVPGIDSVRVDFTTETLEATGSASRDQIESRVRDLGYRIADGTERKQAPRPELRGLGGFLRFLAGERRTQIALAASVLTIVAAVVGPAILEAALLATVVVVGAPILLKGLRSLFVARHVTIDLLMGIATVGAVAIGETGEAAAVVLLFTLGEALESYSAERSRDALRSLLSLQPDEATVLEAHAESHGSPDDDGHHERGAACTHDDHDEHDHGHDHDLKPATQAPAAAAHFHQLRRPTASVPVGAHILVRPGERIPLDGRILDGTSSINQAAVTGESMPVDRTIGDEVLAGTVNGPGALTVEVLRPAGLSTVTRIAQMVERALAERTPAERFIDRFARWYTPLVVALAALLVAVPVLAFGQPFFDLADGTRGWLYRGLAILIIACPCALIISIPVTVVSALARLAQLGVLVKGGAQLDRLAGVNIIAFDKTGTLTIGQPAVTAIRGKDCEHPVAANDDCVSCEDVVAVATAVESASEHPLAQAVVASAQNRGVANRLPRAANITAHVGRGVTGELAGEKISVGTHELFSHDADCADEVCAEAAGLQATGKTVMLVGRGANMVGYIGVEDQPRPDAPAALAELHTLNPNLKTVMLTGDNRSVAEAIARQIGGIDEVRASLLPEHKQSVIRELQKRGTVAMIGDGINDAPALAQADIGIAMGGGGTAQAMETADVVLMQDNLHAIAQTLRISRLTRAVVKQNIALSLGLKLIVLGLAIPGLASLWLAVLADVGATLVVTLNGMRMLRAR
ncbi:MAG: cation-translocating P-type ATPase [Chromatiales bacterium]|jgi:Cd2+/Zn2+-exporting ATPase|nr:MAG: cation-translocating P-type ATPase [Chromatiales bacterium]